MTGPAWLLLQYQLVLILLFALIPFARANTSIVNFDVASLCHHHVDSASEWIEVEAIRISESWPVIHASSEPSLFTVSPAAPPSAGVPPSLDSEHGYWVTLRFPSDPIYRHRQYTVRASWPANHPIDVDLKVMNAQEMVEQGAGERPTMAMDEPDSASSAQPCETLYLHLDVTFTGIAIPPSGRPPPTLHSFVNSLARLDLYSFLVYLSRLYMDPLSNSAPPTKVEEIRTPIHLTFEPLVLDALPLGLLQGLRNLLAMGLVAVTSVVTFRTSGRRW